MDILVLIDVIKDTIIDGMKLLPFLFIAFIIIELLEHKLSSKTEYVITSSKKFGPLLGSFLGLFPQCGFSVVATNLYITRIISLGTLISIYLSTSDEMLPMLLSNKTDKGIIIKILLVKFMIGMISGFIVDLLYKRKRDEIDYKICQKEHCHCNEGVIKSSITHTFNIFGFILIVTFILNMIFACGGEELLLNLFNNNKILSVFFTSLIGFIPNCGSSVIITELYINNIISLSSCISGLLTGSGVALLVLFKSNKDMIENIKILVTLYLIAVLSGILLSI